MKRREVFLHYFGEWIRSVGKNLKDFFTGTIWETFANASLYLSIGIFVLAPIFDYINMHKMGYSARLNYITSFESILLGGGGIGLLTFLFYFIDYITDKISFGAWDRKRSKLIILLVQGILILIFVGFYILARTGLIKRILGVIP